MSVILEDIRKACFVKFLDIIKPAFYKHILDGNRQILETFNMQEPTEDLPLWLVSGGESINFYTMNANKTPTKDIDAKLLFTGDYTINKSIFKGSHIVNGKNIGGSLPKEISHLTTYVENLDEKTNEGDRLLIDSGFNFGSGKIKNYNDYFKEIFKIWKNYEDSHVAKELKQIFRTGFETRGKILWECMGAGINGWQNNTQNTACIGADGNINGATNINEIDKHVNEKTTPWINIQEIEGRKEIKIYFLKIPYLNLSGTDNKKSFPYSCEGNGNYITNSKLNEIQTRLDFLMKNNPSEIWNNYYPFISLMSLDRYLMSLMGVVIIVFNKKYNDKKYINQPDEYEKFIFQEGILDLFIDYHAGEAPASKNTYENKLASGMIPNIIKPITYCNTNSFIRIPTINWLLHDQSRMLYHSLRLQEPRKWSNKGVEIWGDFEDGKQKKYFSKLKGLIQTFYDVIIMLETKYNENPYNKIRLQDMLRECKVDCSPTWFISALYDSFNPIVLIPDDHIKYVCPPQNQNAIQQQFANQLPNPPQNPPQNQQQLEQKEEWRLEDEKKWLEDEQEEDLRLENERLWAQQRYTQQEQQWKQQQQEAQEVDQLWAQHRYTQQQRYAQPQQWNQQQPQKQRELNYHQGFRGGSTRDFTLSKMADEDRTKLQKLHQQQDAQLQKQQSQERKQLEQLIIERRQEEFKKKKGSIGSKLYNRCERIKHKTRRSNKKIIRHNRTKKMNDKN